VLDDRARVGEVERAVVERQPLGGVGADERPGVRGTLDDVGAGDVELRLERPQPKRAAADVEDQRPFARAGQRPEALVAARPRPGGEPRPEPAAEARPGRRVDVRQRR
jgi:hypothetical protein